METLGVYLQVPFCASKCSFCNFSSGVAPASAFDCYCHAVGDEIERLPQLYEAAGIDLELLSLPTDGVYIGGGTPTLLGKERLARIVHTLGWCFKLPGSVEFTLELAPGSADKDLLAALRAMGTNRLSVGAQSFDDRELHAIGRLHDAAEARHTVERARKAGFTNINIDLICGLPYQNSTSWLRTLGQAVELEPEHVSVYLFEIDEKSRLGAEVLRHGDRYHAAEVPGDEFMAEGYETARELLLREGYLQYEISNFARPGYESRHNQKYWQLKPYVGLGAGGHSFDGRRRWANEVVPANYQQRLTRGESPIAELRVLSLEEQIEEFFFLGLRQREGVDLALAAGRWGSDRVGHWQRKISALAADGWLERSDSRIRIPEHAYLVSNEIFQEFVAP